MKTRVVVCALSVLALVVLLGAAPARAEEPAPAPQPAVSALLPAASLPASLTAPAEEEGDCLTLVDPLSGAKTNLCGEGCSFEVPSYCNWACCGGGWGACIDTWDGGYCVC